jgi:hypothetical protein
MSNALTMFDNPQASVPAHIAAFFEQEGNIADKQTVPSLLIEGKVWTRSVDGEKIKLTKRNDDGEMEPIQTLKVIVLDYSKKRGRTYYEGAYDPAKPGVPLCWSVDGNKPDEHVANPQHHECKTCPMSAKGSRITDQGKAVTACASQRMLAVVPAAQPSSTPLRLKLSITSLFDKQSPDLEASGWFAFEQYVDMLRSRGVHHTASVVTKMKFDPDAAYPKVIFSPDRWLEQSELAVVAPISKSDDVAALINGTFTPDGGAGVPVEDFEQGDNVPEPTKPAAAKPAAPKPVTARKPEIKPAPKPEPVVETVAEQAAAAVASDVPDDVAALLADWG